MFGKKRCSSCDRKMEKKFDFCPYCGSPAGKEDYGILGKTDDINEIDRKISHGFADTGIGSKGSFTEKIFDSAFKSAMKLLEKEMKSMNFEETLPKVKNEAKNPNKNIHTHMELFINGKRVNLPGNISGIQISPMHAGGAPKQNMPIKAPAVKISEEKIKSSAKLPRKEAKSRISRTGDKVIYELETPGISSPEDILINQLENSLEIKAFTEKAVYLKTLPAKLQLLRYAVNPAEGKLVLEFKGA